jgi:hypothetical protein
MMRKPDKTIGGPYDRCIYCLNPAGQVPFTDEHVLPQGLGGNSVLRNASCSDCQKITCRNENEVLRKMWQVGRRSLGLGGGSKKKKKHKSSEFFIASHDGSVVEISLTHANLSILGKDDEILGQRLLTIKHLRL